MSKRRNHSGIRGLIAAVCGVVIVSHRRWEKKCNDANSLEGAHRHADKLRKSCQRLSLQVLSQKKEISDLRDSLTEMRGIVAGLLDVKNGRTRSLASIENGLTAAPPATGNTCDGPTADGARRTKD
jgi:hypothetical protein